VIKGETVLKKNRFKSHILPGWLIWFTLTAIFSFMGLSLAVWQDQLTISGTASTGKIDLVLTECWIIKQEANRVPPDVLTDTTARIECDGKKIFIDIENTHPGYNVWFGYKIVNQGSFPLKLQATSNPVKLLIPGTMKLSNTLSTTVLDVGESATGVIHITIKGVDELSEYNFELSVDFIQWNFSIN
jgi:hypothetical protein